MTYPLLIIFAVLLPSFKVDRTSLDFEEWEDDHYIGGDYDPENIQDYCKLLFRIEDASGATLYNSE